MAQILKDKDAAMFSSIVAKLMQWPDDKPLPADKVASLLTALMLVLVSMIEVENLDVDDLVEEHKNHKHGKLVKATKLFENLLKVFMNEFGAVTMSNINGVPWYFADDQAPMICGIIPQFIEADDERPLTEQIDSHYQHGGGWRPLNGWALDTQTWAITYTNKTEERDPPYQPLGGTCLHGEIVAIYPSGWTLVVSEHGDNMQVARLD